MPIKNERSEASPRYLRIARGSTTNVSWTRSSAAVALPTSRRAKPRSSAWCATYACSTAARSPSRRRAIRSSSEASGVIVITGSGSRSAVTEPWCPVALRPFNEIAEAARAAVDVAGRRLLGGGLAPLGAFAALLRDRAYAAAEHGRAILERIGAILDRMGVDAGGHANRIARAGLDAQAADHAAQLVDLEERRALLDRLGIRFLGDDRDAVGRADRRAAHARDAANRAVLAQHQPVKAAEALRIRDLLLGVLDRLDVVERHAEKAALLDGGAGPRTALGAAHRTEQVLREVLDRDPEALRGRREERRVLRRGARDLDGTHA